MNEEIIGCRFSLAVMNDDYANMILKALKNLNTDKIWVKSDKLSTTYRGKLIHVTDALKACFININDGKTHITMEATFSKGCPNYTSLDSFIAKDNILLNPTTKSFEVLAKIAFYPLGTIDYMKHIEFAIDLARKHGVFKEISHYATELLGDINKLFYYFNDLLLYAEEIKHFALQVTLSVNSPTKF